MRNIQVILLPFLFPLKVSYRMQFIYSYFWLAFTPSQMMPVLLPQSNLTAFRLILLILSFYSVRLVSQVGRKLTDSFSRRNCIDVFSPLHKGGPFYHFCLALRKHHDVVVELIMMKKLRDLDYRPPRLRFRMYGTSGTYKRQVCNSCNSIWDMLCNFKVPKCC